jgi:hypothetical protein
VADGSGSGDGGSVGGTGGRHSMEAGPNGGAAAARGGQGDGGVNAGRCAKEGRRGDRGAGRVTGNER